MRIERAKRILAKVEADHNKFFNALTTRKDLNQKDKALLANLAINASNAADRIRTAIAEEEIYN